MVVLTLLIDFGFVIFFKKTLITISISTNIYRYMFDTLDLYISLINNSIDIIIFIGQPYYLSISPYI